MPVPHQCPCPEELGLPKCPCPNNTWILVQSLRASLSNLWAAFLHNNWSLCYFGKPVGTGNGKRAYAR
eukprot:11215610-Lingulodinium_polyedra.AAC.1